MTRIGTLEKRDRWNGMQVGDKAVVVAAEWPQFRGITFEFVSHVVNTKNGDTYVELAGGKRGHDGVRAFRPETVLPKRSRSRS